MNKTYRHDPRRGAAAILILLMTSLMFIAIVFSIDIARIQLAQMELQSGVDLASRAGSEALARGVGEGASNAAIDTMIREEINMIAQLNHAGGEPIQLNSAASIQFGKATEQAAGTYLVTTSGSYNNVTDSVEVTANVPSFPVVFGGFVSQESVNLTEKSSSMVKERDMVVVLDRSTSMLTHDAGSIPVSQYPANLRQLEDAIYGPGESFYPGGNNYSTNRNTEFDISGGDINLTRIQALKLAVLKFRQEIETSRGREFLGLASYSQYGDTPAQSYQPTENIDIEAGLSQFIFDKIKGDGITYNDEHYASALESETVNYRSFDYNYLAIRRHGNTNIVDGLERGADILYGAGHRQFATPVLILMTDGNHNQSGDPLTTATNLMAAHPELKIYTVSFGDGANQTVMADIAAIGKGEHNHANDVNQLVAIFKDLANSAGVTLIQ